MTAQQAAAEISDGTSNERILIENRGSGTGTKFRVIDGGAVQAEINTTLTIVANQSVRTASAYQLNNFATVVNGGAVGTATSGTLPTVNKLDIGRRDASVYLNGYIQRISYYPVRLSNAQLQALTA
jgi:hypothetical protein